MCVLIFLCAFSFCTIVSFPNKPPHTRAPNPRPQSADSIRPQTPQDGKLTQYKTDAFPVVPTTAAATKASSSSVSVLALHCYYRPPATSSSLSSPAKLPSASPASPTPPASPASPVRLTPIVHSFVTLPPLTSELKQPWSGPDSSRTQSNGNSLGPPHPLLVRRRPRVCPPFPRP